MSRRFASKADYRRYVRRIQERTKSIARRVKTAATPKFRPKIATEKDYFNNKYQNVVRGYQNVAVVDAFRGRSQEEWRWLHYQGSVLSFSEICEQMERTKICSDVGMEDLEETSVDLRSISEPFGHNLAYAHLEPLRREARLVLYDYKVLQFSGNGQINSFLDLVLKLQCQ